MFQIVKLILDLTPEKSNNIRFVANKKYYVWVTFIKLYRFSRFKPLIAILKRYRLPW